MIFNNLEKNTMSRKSVQIANKNKSRTTTRLVISKIYQKRFGICWPIEYL